MIKGTELLYDTGVEFFIGVMEGEGKHFIFHTLMNKNLVYEISSSSLTELKQNVKPILDCILEAPKLYLLDGLIFSIFPDDFVGTELDLPTEEASFKDLPKGELPYPNTTLYVK